MDVRVPETEQFSSQQRSVFAELVRGRAEREIAERLSISPHTIHGYVKKIYRQFDVSSRGELIYKLLERQTRKLSVLERRIEALGGSIDGGGDGITDD